jgi:hypothetical protein
VIEAISFQNLNIMSSNRLKQNARKPAAQRPASPDSSPDAYKSRKSSGINKGAGGSVNRQ